MSEHTIESLTQRLNDMIDFVDQARDRVDGGDLVDLGDLDGQVGTLCSDIESSDPQTAMEVAALMGKMISALEDLARALRDFQDRSGTHNE